MSEGTVFTAERHQLVGLPSSSVFWPGPILVTGIDPNPAVPGPRRRRRNRCWRSPTAVGVPAVACSPLNSPAVMAAPHRADCPPYATGGVRADQAAERGPAHGWASPPWAYWLGWFPVAPINH